MLRSQEELCLAETKHSITSISTTDYVPQPVNEKSHFIRNRIFVGNFPETATHKDVSTVFSYFGKIIETNIIDSPNSMARYGFVTFQSIASADEVIKLSCQGKEFRVNGKLVTINRALFKPKKQSSSKAAVGVSNSHSVMVVGGRPIATKFANGMVYFQPVNKENVSRPARMVHTPMSTLCPKNIRTYLPYSPPIQVANHYSISSSLRQTNSIFQLPAVITPKNLNSNISLSPFPPCYHNFRSFVPAPTHHQSNYIVTSM